MIGNQVQRPRSIATDECIKAVLSGQVSLFEFFLCDIRRIKVRPQGFFSHAFDKGPVVIQTIPRTIVDPDIFLYGTGLTGSFIVECVEDRKSVVSGKSVSVRVDLGGRRIITKKIKET